MLRRALRYLRPQIPITGGPPTPLARIGCAGISFAITVSSFDYAAFLRAERIYRLATGLSDAKPRRP